MMQQFLSEYYLWAKSLHLIFVISWMAGLFYLPRLFVYHTTVETGSDQDKLFQTMEIKLLRIIMNPAMILTWASGALLIVTPGVAAGDDKWLYGKLLAIVLMTAFHMALAGWRSDFVASNNKHSERFYRQANEVPTILMLVIVVLAVVKPF